MQTRLTNLLKATQQNPSSNFYNIQSTLNKLLRAGSAEKQANQSYIEDITPKIIYNLVSNVSNIDQNNMTALSQYAAILKDLRDFIPPNFVNNAYISQIRTAIQDVEDMVKQAAVKEIRKAGQQRMTNQISLQTINQPLQISTNLTNLKLPPSEASGIEGALSNIIDVLDAPPITGLIDPNSLPPTMQLLAKYAQQIGYTPMGTLSGRKSRVYVGLQKTEQDGSIIMKPFPFEKGPVTSISSIKNQYKNYAGRTINAWNNYVAAEQNFVQFANQISTKQKRQEFIQKQIRSMNTVTFTAQALSTLVFYYIYVPLKYSINRFKTKLSEGSYGWQTFYKDYSLPPGQSWNPLTLSYEDIKKIVLKLFNCDQNGKSAGSALKITTLADQVFAIIKDKGLLAMGKANIKTLTAFPANRMLQATAYMGSLDIPKTQSDKILASGIVEDLIFVTVEYPSEYTNSQILSIINNAISKTQDKDQYSQGLWGLTWMADKLPAYDYIWGKKY